MSKLTVKYFCRLAYLIGLEASKGGCHEKCYYRSRMPLLRYSSTKN